MKKIIINIMTIFIIVTDLTYIIAYLNLLDEGYNFIMYLKYVFNEILLLIIGSIMLIINNKGGK